MTCGEPLGAHKFLYANRMLPIPPAAAAPSEPSASMVGALSWAPGSSGPSGESSCRSVLSLPASVRRAGAASSEWLLWAGLQGAKERHQPGVWLPRLADLLAIDFA